MVLPPGWLPAFFPQRVIQAGDLEVTLRSLVLLIILHLVHFANKLFRF